MKKGIFVIVAIAAVWVTGCVSTVTDEKTAGVKMSADRVENRYQFPLNQVFEASKRALESYGQVSRESTLLGSTNQVRTLQGKANDRDVWIRVEAVTPQVTAVTVQARSTWSGSDVQTAHEVATRVALQLSK
jgi:hypothetical protein